MKAVILAGGLGTRLSEETSVKPKPMVEIAGMPIIWHIMKYYSCYGITDFIICAGYKGYVLKEFFSNYVLHSSDVTIETKSNKLIFHRTRSEDWRVTIVDTGKETMTGGRLKRVVDYLDNEYFHFTYGDGLSDVDITELHKVALASKKKAVVTAVMPPGRFGALEINADGIVNSFLEKPQGDGALINGGYFVLHPSVIEYIESDETVWEQEPLINLAKDHELSAYHHRGFWQPMDTLREKHLLEGLVKSGEAPWIKW